MINGGKLKSGEVISVKAVVDDDQSPVSDFVLVNIGIGFNKIRFAVHENDIFGRVPSPKTIKAGDNCLWNTTMVKVLCINDNKAWVRLYKPTDDPMGQPTGSHTTCDDYTNLLKPSPRGF